MAEPMYDNEDMREADRVAKSRRIRARLYAATYYQHEASRTLIDEPDFELTAEEMMILWNADGLAGEVGEMMDMVKKAIWHRHGIGGLKGDKFKKELGDICWYLAAMCTKLGFDLGEVMYSNIEKLKIRFPEGYKQEQTIVGERFDEVDPESNHPTEDIYYIDSPDPKLIGFGGVDMRREETMKIYNELMQNGLYFMGARLILGDSTPEQCREAITEIRKARGQE